MPLSAVLHNAIVKYNVLERPTRRISEYFAFHPKAFKTALVVNHVFRAAAMAGFMLALPFSVPANLALCFGGSLFYRLTVEDKCAYKFALPAAAGAGAFLVGKGALAALVSGAAFASIGAFAAALLAIAPLCAYITYVCLTVSYDVDNRPCPFCVNPQPVQA